MSLWSSKILYLFLDVTEVRLQRDFLEEVLGLEVIENQFHPPHHHHGIIKYDAGDVVLALNIADGRFDGDRSDGIVTVFAATPMREAQIYADLQVLGYAAPQQAGDAFADRDHHLYALRQRLSASEYDSEDPRVYVDELRLTVQDLPTSVTFYKDVLDLVMLDRTASTVTFATENLRLVLLESKQLIDHLPVRHEGYLIVFHVDDIQKSYDALSRRGLEFNGKVGYSDIGGSVRFTDPTGHVFCLYQPSAESLTWDSGKKVEQIISFQHGVTI